MAFSRLRRADLDIPTARLCSCSRHAQRPKREWCPAMFIPIVVARSIHGQRVGPPVTVLRILRQNRAESVHAFAVVMDTPAYLHRALQVPVDTVVCLPDSTLCGTVVSYSSKGAVAYHWPHAK